MNSFGRLSYKYCISCLVILLLSTTIFHASCIDLCRCISAALNRHRLALSESALILLLKAYLAMRRITISVPDEAHRALKLLGILEAKSFGAVVLEALEFFLKSKDAYDLDVSKRSVES